MITIQNADAALKDYYLEAFSKQLDSDVSPFYSAIEKTTVNVVGKDAKLAIVKGNMGNILAGDEDGDLPSPYSNRYYSITVPLKNIYGTIEISDKALRASRETAGAFVNLVNAEMEGLIKSARCNLARMMYGDGNGKISTFVARDGGYKMYITNVKGYFLGMKVDIMNGTNVLLAGITITDINVEKNYVLIDKDISGLTLTGTVTIHVSGAYGKELCGLDGIFQGTTLYGYDKSTNSYFNPVHKYIELDEITESSLVDYINMMDDKYDSKVNLILCSNSMKQTIAEALAVVRRTVNTTDITVGYSSLIINNIPVVSDKFCPENKIYLLNTDDFMINQLCDWEWLEDEDGKVLKQVPGKAAYSATLVKYAELVCKNPGGQCLLEVE